MIITRTPFRISFFGGGTDYPIYYQEHGGACLSTTINKYCYITARYLPPFFEHKYAIRYSRKELCNILDEIQHPSVRECLRFVGEKKGVEMIHTSDIPAMSGIGSSSAFTVGFLNVLNALNGKMTTKRQLALDAIHVEQKMINENVGSQDQVAAAFGGFNRIDFGGHKEIFVTPMFISLEKLENLQKNLLFFFTGFSRNSSDIASDQIKNTPKKINELSEMQKMVDEAISILCMNSHDLNDFGKLMHESWKIKRSLTNKITNNKIDEIYETAINAGALGGKICGAGGGGFILLYVPEDRQNEVRERLKNLLLVPIRFENLGSHVIFYSN